MQFTPHRRPHDCIHSGVISPFSRRIGKLSYFPSLLFLTKDYMENATPYFIFIASCGVFSLSIFILLVFFDRRDSDLYSKNLSSRKGKIVEKRDVLQHATVRQMKFKSPLRPESTISICVFVFACDIETDSACEIGFLTCVERALFGHQPRVVPVKASICYKGDLQPSIAYACLRFAYMYLVYRMWEKIPFFNSERPRIFQI